MRRLLARVVSLLSHRLLLPVVCGLFLLCYIVIAFFTDEALVTLVQLSAHNPPALGLLVLVALNALFRMVADCHGTAGAGGNLILSVTGRLDVDGTSRILTEAGYQVTAREGFLSARQGWRLLIPLILWRLTVFLLFVGVALSISSRSSQRLPVIEGEKLQLSGMAPRQVERIVLEETSGHLFLQNRLTISLLASGGSRNEYGVYPPGMLGTLFLYPRYLAVAPLLRIAGPGIGVTEGYQLVMLYPPGREDEVILPGNHRLKLVIPQREGGADPFVSGRFDLHVKLLGGEQVLFEGNVPFGGRLAANGFNVELLDARRYVVTDLVRDYGVLCIWMAAVTAFAALMIYLPLRFLRPHRLMTFSYDPDRSQIVASCISEGRRRQNEALFYDLLDKISRNR